MHTLNESFCGELAKDTQKHLAKLEKITKLVEKLLAEKRPEDKHFASLLEEIDGATKTYEALLAWAGRFGVVDSKKASRKRARQ